MVSGPPRRKFKLSLPARRASAFSQLSLGLVCFVWSRVSGRTPVWLEEDIRACPGPDKGDQILGYELFVGLGCPTRNSMPASGYMWCFMNRDWTFPSDLHTLTWDLGSFKHENIENPRTPIPDHDVVFVILPPIPDHADDQEARM